MFLVNEGVEEPVRLDFGDKTDLELTAVVFGDPSLGELGLPMGEVQPQEPGPLTRPLVRDPSAVELFEARLGEGWSPIDVIPESVGSVHLPDLERRCPEIVVQDVYAIPGTIDAGRVTAGVVLNEEQVLLAFELGRLFRADTNGGVSELRPRGLDARPTALFAADNHLFVGTASGGIYRSNVDTPEELAPYLSSPSQTIDIGSWSSSPPVSPKSS